MSQLFPDGCDQPTPGPWLTSDQAEDGSVRIYADDTSLYAMVLGWPSHALPNARLMAAAPKLYARLEDVAASTHNADCHPEDAPDFRQCSTPWCRENARILTEARGEPA